MGAELFETADSELVVGLVAPIGCDRAIIHSALEDIFSTRQFKINSVRISELLQSFAGSLGVELKETPFFDRVNSYMDAGNELRKQASRSDALALCAAHSIASIRPASNEGGLASRLSRTVHVLDSLKHPEEIRTLRRIYGPGFYLLGIFASRSVRLKYLMKTKRLNDQQANSILDRDEDESEQAQSGQRTRDTFHLADVFIDTGDSSSARARLERFFNLVFGEPHLTPTQDEVGMYAAASAALRSGALARQIGAALVDREGDLVAVGHNDVPKAGGGLYCEDDGENDCRDHKLGRDSNSQRIDGIALAAANSLSSAGLVQDVAEAARVIARSDLRRVTEYGRAVHAEMAALLAAARRGACTRDCVLFTTTFPCHNCAKHAIAAGIERIVYIEPYPKSEALSLHDDAIIHSDERKKPVGSHSGVRLEPFLGVSPRRYAELFSMVKFDGVNIDRKDHQGNATVSLSPIESQPRSPMLPIAYPEREKHASVLLLEIRDSISGVSDG